MLDHVIHLLRHTQDLLSYLFHVVLKILGDDFVGELLVGIVRSVCLRGVVQ